jgi:L-aspartate semialdehyde sulfurtransferase ferredoxin
MSRRVKLTFPPDLVREPILASMVRQFDVMANIRRADVTDDFGWIVCELDGDTNAVDAAIAWLTETGVAIDQLEQPLEG